MPFLAQWIQHNQPEVLANVLLYIPMGVVLIILWPKARLWLLSFCANSYFSTRELSQHLFLPDRYATVNDAMSNFFGGVLGMAIAENIRRRMRNSKTEN